MVFVETCLSKIAADLPELRKGSTQDVQSRIQLYKLAILALQCGQFEPVQELLQAGVLHHKEAGRVSKFNYSDLLWALFRTHATQQLLEDQISGRIEQMKSSND